MPNRPWAGYERFCPLARALDVVGDRWTLVIIQELLKRASRYGELAERLPGIGSSVLADRLRRLQSAGVVVRSPGAVGEGVVYELTERGRALEAPLRALREWGAEFLFDPDADGRPEHRFDMAYVAGIGALSDCTFELVVDDVPTTLSFAAGVLGQAAGPAAAPELRIRTTRRFLERWAGGEIDWDGGLADGEVTSEGRAGAWARWLAATGYVRRYELEPLGAADG